MDYQGSKQCACHQMDPLGTLFERVLQTNPVLVLYHGDDLQFHLKVNNNNDNHLYLPDYRLVRPPS